MKAQDFAIRHGIAIEQKGSGDNATIARYRDGHYVIRLPRKWKLDSEDTQRVIWHELGHFVDHAGHLGGHSQLTSFAQYGRFSTPNRELLSRHRVFLQGRRPPATVEVRARYHGKTMTLEQLLASPDVPENLKKRFEMGVRLKQSRHEHILKNYLEQPIEVFADGFAQYMMDPESMMDEHFDLAIVFEMASRNPADEELREPRRPMPASRPTALRRRRPLPSGLQGAR